MSRIRIVLGAPPLPTEHGSWAMLAVPLLFGLAASGEPNGPALWVVAGTILVFLARAAAVPTLARVIGGRRELPRAHVARRLAWSGIYLAAAVASVGMAVAGAGPVARGALLQAGIVPLALGLAHVAWGLLGKDRQTIPEIVGMGGLSATAPLIVAASGRPPGFLAWGAGLLALVYFLSSLSFVRAFRRIREGKRRAAARCVAAHAFLAAAAVYMWAAGFVPGLATAALVPVGARTAWGLIRPPRNLKQLGWREVAIACSFALLGAYGLWP